MCEVPGEENDYDGLRRKAFTVLMTQVMEVPSAVSLGRPLPCLCQELRL